MCFNKCVEKRKCVLKAEFQSINLERSKLILGFVLFLTNVTISYITKNNY